MPEAILHDGSTIEIEVHGSGPTLLLPVNPQPMTGEQAEQMRQYGNDPALGQSLIKGLKDVFRVVAFDYEGQCFRLPKPGTLTPVNIVNDLLAVADAAGADQFAYYGYSWLAMIGLQLAIRTDRLLALIMGGFPPLDGPYEEMLRVTAATYKMAGVAQTSQAADADEWSSVSLSKDQTKQFVTLYQALQEFDDQAAQVRITCPRLCFVGSADDLPPISWSSESLGYTLPEGGPRSCRRCTRPTPPNVSEKRCDELRPVVSRLRTSLAIWGFLIRRSINGARSWLNTTRRPSQAVDIRLRKSSKCAVSNANWRS